MIVIGIKGLIGSGKSTLAGYLIERHGFVRGRFAGALKEMLRALLRYRGVDEATIERMIDGDLKEEPSPHLNWRSPREAMEALGTGWGRELIHADLWVDTESDHLFASQPARVIFEDVRFKNEAHAIRRLGGRIWEVSQPGLRPKKHRTEREQQSILANDLIVNRIGELYQTHKQAEALLAAMVMTGAA